MSNARSIWRLAAVAALGLGLVGVAPQALAQSRPPAPAPSAPVAQKVAVEVMVVHATNAHTRVDARLKAMLSHLKHLNYTGYEVLDVRANDLTPGQESSFAIAGGKRMVVGLIEHDERQARLRVRMYSGSRGLLDTTVSVHRNRSFIVAGPEYEGGVLILPMTASY